MIEFGEWLPDQSDLANSGVLEAKNVVPAIRGYRPFRDLAVVSGAADSYLRSMFATRDQTGVNLIFAGDNTKLYKYDSTNSSLANASQAGNYSLGTKEKWQFAQFGDNLLAAGGHAQVLQNYVVGTSTLFADISGSPAARYMASIRDFIVCGNVVYGGNTHQERLYWSAINDSQSWTIGTNQSDIQDIADSGAITGIVGGQFGVVFTQRGIHRLEYVGTPLVFTVEKVETQHGCEIPGSIVSLSTNQIFYVAQNGFMMFDGSRSIPIGAEKVDNWFYDNLNAAFTNRVTSTIDPNNQIVLWSFPSNSSSDGTPDTIIVYNYAVNRWSIVELTHQSIGTILLPGYTLEELDTINTNIDALTTSFDSPIYAGESFSLAASKDNKLQSFTGDILGATITSREFEVTPMRSSAINSVTPYITAKNAVTTPTLTVSVGSRSRQIDDVTFTSASSLNADNICNVRSHGRYHRVKIETTGDFRYALGIDVDAKPLGRR